MKRESKKIHFGKIQHQKLKAKTRLPKLGIQHGKPSDVPSSLETGYSQATLNSPDTKINEQPYFWQDS